MINLLLSCVLLILFSNFAFSAGKNEHRSQPHVKPESSKILGSDKVKSEKHNQSKTTVHAAKHSAKTRLHNNDHYYNSLRRKHGTTGNDTKYRFKPYFGLEMVHQNMDVSVATSQLQLITNAATYETQKQETQSSGLGFYSGIEIKLPYYISIAPELFYTHYRNNKDDLLKSSLIQYRLVLRSEYGARINAGFNFADMVKIYGIAGYGRTNLVLDEHNADSSITHRNKSINAPFYGASLRLGGKHVGIQAKILKKRFNFSQVFSYDNQNFNNEYRVTSTYYTLGLDFRF